MNKKLHTPLTDSYLQSVEGMQPVELPPFFYTRLKARMEQSVEGRPSFMAKPVLAIALLGLVLVLNTVVLVQQHSAKPQASSAANNAFDSFTNDFNLITGSNY
jgi:hypothetical protein